jgi:hypothetical protein
MGGAGGWSGGPGIPRRLEVRFELLESPHLDHRTKLRETGDDLGIESFTDVSLT